VLQLVEKIEDFVSRLFSRDINQQSQGGLAPEVPTNP
jgi:hypothetical protein